MKKLKARGTRGSWFAEVEGRLLPCVHMHWVKWPNYDDKGIVPGTPKEDEYISGIKQGTVILTTDDVVSKEPFQFRRTGYVAIYTISDVTADAGGITFRFVTREHDLE